MRIAITAPSLDTNANISGISSVASFILRHNTGCEYRHFLIGRRDGQPRNISWLVETLKLYPQWLWTLFTGGIDLVHFNLSLERCSLVRDLPLIVLARLLRFRILIHVHGGEYLAKTPIPAWLARVIALSFGSCPVAVLSPIEKLAIEKALRRAGVFVLPNCVDIGEAGAFARDASPAEPLTVLYMGRISESKGIDDAIEAIELARQDGTNIRFVVAGSGPAADAFVERCRRALGPDFEFKGVVAGADKAQTLGSCDVFLLPSHFEGLPMALLESMAFGLAPITTRVGSIPTVIEHGKNGLFVDIKSPSQIAATLRALAADRNYLRALSRSARERMIEHCSVRRYLELLNEVYNCG